MGLQINSQPQNFKSSVVIGDGLSAVSGLTVYGSLSASSNLHASSISAGNVTALAGGKFYGDGSGLTNINFAGFSGVTSVNGLSGAVTNVVFTGSANNFTQPLTGTTGLFTTSLSSPSLSGVHFGDGSKLTGIVSTTSLSGLTGDVFVSLGTNGSWSGYSNAQTNQIANFGTGDFTVEFWVRPTSNANGTIFDSYDYSMRSASTFRGLVIQKSSSTNLLIINSGLNAITSTAALTLNSWYHIAVVKQSGNITLYINGSSDTTLPSENTDFISGQNRPIIGAQQGIINDNIINGFGGQISNVRVVKQAIYTSAFTPPSSPLTITSNVAGQPTITASNVTFLSHKETQPLSDVSNYNYQVIGTNTTFNVNIIPFSNLIGDTNGSVLVYSTLSGKWLSTARPIISSISANTGIFFTGLSSTTLSSQTITTTGLSTTNLTGSNGSFVSLTASSLSAGNYLSGGKNLTEIFGDKLKTDSVFLSVQTYSADWTVGKTLSTGGLTPTIGYRFVNNNPAVYGDLTIYGRINALSGATFTDTTFTTTSSLCVYNKMNTGAALYVGASGSGDIASFYDIDGNVEVLHVGGATGSFPGVGIRVSAPTKTLTISGEISATGDVWFGSNIYANNQNLTALYADKGTNTTVSSNSGYWRTAYNIVTGGGTLSGTGLTVQGYLSSPSISGTHYGSGTNLTGVALTASNNTFTGIQTFSVLNATTSLSSPAISGTHYGSGANLTGVALTASNNTFTGIQTFSVLNATTSLSSPAISGTHYGSGANLTNISLPAAGTFSTSVSSPSISAVNFYGNTVAPVTNQSTTFTLALSNAGGIIRIGPASNTQVYVNVPTNASVAFPIGTQTILAQVSAATVTVSAAAGVTLLSYQSKTSLAAQNSVASLIKTNTDEWLFAGDIN